MDLVEQVGGPLHLEGGNRECGLCALDGAEAGSIARRRGGGAA